ncbi:DUF4294 domain-containing protein [Mesonia sp. JHPTF-M18]|uniref:DUF4294 domain-containing protein n=2 Tax=Mesonia aestuariivivens TaxID=2796128 RepID=A0ABS6VZQ2_9FLAO|nr:DUF4294 domain-containing protein [Mesonia aestuariivivens]
MRSKAVIKTSEEKKVKDTLVVDSLNEKKLMVIDDQVMEAIDLDEVFLVGPFKFKNRYERRRYLILQKKTRHVWPYAVLASQRLTALNERLNSIESKSKKRKYTKMVQNYIQDEFTAELKKLTKTEGQILVKLMYRQTGITTFDIVKDLKSGWRAFWYNTTASLFNISLKEEFHPEEVEEDFLIEHILRRNFQKNHLDKQEPAIEINFLKAVEKWQ